MIRGWPPTPIEKSWCVTARRPRYRRIRCCHDRSRFAPDAQRRKRGSRAVGYHHRGGGPRGGDAVDGPGRHERHQRPERPYCLAQHHLSPRASCPRVKYVDCRPAMVAGQHGPLRNPDYRPSRCRSDGTQLAAPAQQLSTVPGAVQVRGINTDASLGGAAGGFPTNELKTLLAVGVLALLLPVLIFIVTAARLAAASREQRFAAMRLVAPPLGRSRSSRRSSPWSPRSVVWRSASGCSS